MARAYYLLLARDAADSPWRVEFGAKDREDVVADHPGTKSRNLKILPVNSSRQSCVDYGVARLNGTN